MLFTDELLELQQMEDTICKKTKSFDELNKKYRRLENVESLLSIKASCEVDATINEIKSHKVRKSSSSLYWLN